MEAGSPRHSVSTMKQSTALADPIRLLVALFLTAASHSPSVAQSVFKCTVASKTVYQSSPCAGQGKELNIAPGPSESEVQEAKMRADAQKSRTATYPASTQQRPQNPPVVVKPVDCAKLNKDRGDAFGRRNATIRDSRESNTDRSATVNSDHDDIRRIESQMIRAGCKPT
jgi:hypothetical protein